MDHDPGTARFALWPLPDLRLGVSGESRAAEPAPEEREYQRGMEEGRAAGRLEMEQSLKQSALALEAARRELMETRERWLAQSDRLLHTLAIAVARQIVQHEVTCEPSIVRQLVRRALEEVSGDDATEIRMNPADLSALTHHAEVSGEDWPSQARWIADPSIERGGCVVESTERIVDGRLEAALSDVYHRLTDE